MNPQGDPLGGDACSFGRVGTLALPALSPGHSQARHFKLIGSPKPQDHLWVRYFKGQETDSHKRHRAHQEPRGQ